jgi:uncharacterized protein (DUF934 family)
MGILIKERRAASASPPLPEVEVVRLGPGDDPASLADRLGGVARIEVHFPTFGDGRGYSIARLLRSRYGYRGELRAVGHITRDQLAFLERVGFDAFELRAGEDATEALVALDTFSAAYQKA